MSGIYRLQSILASVFHRLRAGFRYLLRRRGIGHIGSRYVRTVMGEALQIDKDNPQFREIERLRRELLRSKKMIDVRDLGAGSAFRSKKSPSVGSIAKSALSPARQCQIMANLCRNLEGRPIIELGTSLGISTAYMATAAPKSKVFTMEGSPDIARMARAHFDLLGLTNIELVEGHFDATLPDVLAKIEQVGLGFIDGNHRKEATLHYFNLLLPKISQNSILVFDDIHWSPGMEKAWQEIKNHPQTRASIDLFGFGLVFFHEELLSY